MEIGKKIFHVRDISWSYRMRGRVARDHKNKRIKIIVLIQRNKLELKYKNPAPINNKADSILIKRIFKYSAINKNANLIPPYSTLNPDTNSDSPSAKSKGARFVSARVVINHKIIAGNIININHILIFVKLCS